MAEPAVKIPFNVADATELEVHGYRAGFVLIRLKDEERVIAEAAIGFDHAVTLAGQLCEMVKQLRELGPPAETETAGHA